MTGTSAAVGASTAPMSDDAALAFLDGGSETPPPARGVAPAAEAPGGAAEGQDGQGPRESSIDALQGLMDLRKATEPTQAAPATEAQPEAAQPATEAPAQANDQESFVLGLRALKRWKTPQKAIDAMSRAEVIAWGQEVAGMQGNLDDIARRSKAPQQNTDPREPEPAASKPEPQEARAAKGDTKPVAEGTPRVDLSATTTKLAEVLGLDARDGQVLETALSAIVEPLRSELAARDQRDRARDNLLAEMMLQDSRRRLQGQFPGLEDATQFQAVRERAQKLIGSGGYDNLDDAMEDASRMVFFNSATNDAATQASKLARAKALGSVAAPSQTRPASRDLSPDEQETEALALIEAGVPADEIQARLGLR